MPRDYYEVLLVGAGQLGSRYLQGLAKSELHLQIRVVDTSEAALATSHERWLEVGGSQSGSHIELHTTIGSSFNTVDLVIVSTPAGGRAALMSSLARNISPSYSVIEKVLAQSPQELEEIYKATADAKASWVNTPRRLMAWHKALKSVFSNNGPIRVLKDGGLWGLACNAIHFIDLVSWWSGESLIAIDTSELDSGWISSKRVGYFEVTGVLVAHYSGGSELIMSSREPASQGVLQVNITNGDCWLIDEANGSAQSSTGIHINGRLEYQSELTAPLVNEILTNATCCLPTLKESSAQHAIFLDALLNHWNRSHNSNDKRVPIT